ncbi:MAG: hypothetical protein DI536_05360 [Archangium gephyra]|uniref:Uncharacterized protein n=1 Tax=Archangium gephyra TaxID=48 RepID=A0A2W5TTJ3_9BACT|nr:MAG: hypothetical protein DI536_05360 [Archangium gephyra]
MRESKLWWFVGALVLTIATVLAASIVAGANFGTALLWALAFFGVGAIPGFLLGVPRVLQSDGDAATASKKAYEQRVNTSLEQVSDWLTKGLIGVGLVELTKLPGIFASAGAFMAKSFGEKGPAAEFCTAIAVVFVIQGFLMSYLFTRLQLSMLFRVADEAVSADDVETVVSAPLQLPDAVVKAAPEVVRVVKRLAELPSDQVAATDVAAWAKSKLFSKSFDEAISGFQRALRIDPTNQKLLLDYAAALFQANRPEEAIDQLEQLLAKLKDGADAAFIEQVYAWLTYAWLFEAPPTGFEAAIRHGENYVKSGSTPLTGDVFVNLAAGYGQKAKMYDDKKEPIPPDVKAAVLKWIDESLKVRPSWKKRLRQLTFPNEPGFSTKDADLVAFQDDPDVLKVLGPRP